MLLGLSPIAMAAATQGGGLGIELWVQPTFSAGTGVTLTSLDGNPTFPTIAGGLLSFGADGLDDGEASATALATLTAGTYRIVGTSTNSAGAYIVNIGTNPQEFVGNSTSPESLDLVVPSVSNQLISITNNYVGQVLTALSVIKIA